MGKTSRQAVLAGACRGALGATSGRVPAAWAAGGRHTDLSADQALDLLRKGNAAFVADAPSPPVETHRRRLEIARGQAPFAVLVGCSDSRVPPELLFGRGLGELFVIRVAGNTVGTTVLGSIEYAVAQLGVPLVVVLGHERCGAVADAVEVVERNATFPGSIGDMVGPIIPAVLKARGQPGDLLDNAVRENVRRVVGRLHEAGPILPEAERAGRLRIVGARYDLDDGSVEFL